MAVIFNNIYKKYECIHLKNLPSLGNISYHIKFVKETFAEYEEKVKNIKIAA